MDRVSMSKELRQEAASLSKRASDLLKAAALLLDVKKIAFHEIAEFECAAPRRYVACPRKLTPRRSKYV
jgi:hypothetical protein